MFTNKIKYLFKRCLFEFWLTYYYVINAPLLFYYLIKKEILTFKLFILHVFNRL